MENIRADHSHLKGQVQAGVQTPKPKETQMCSLKEGFNIANDNKAKS